MEERHSNVNLKGQTLKEFSLTSIPYFDLIRENLQFKEMENDESNVSFLQDEG
jgi:hypothetical protein